MFSARQHPDIGAGTEDTLLPRRKNDDTHFRMFKPHSLDDVGKLDVDGNREVALKYSIQSIPTVILLMSGEVVNKFVGLQGKDVFAGGIDDLLG